MSRKIYLASSWRNPWQPQFVDMLTAWGHEVYDFRNPKPGAKGFAWSDLDPEWQTWDRHSFVNALDNPIAEAGFANDWEAMEWADTGVLLLPSGRSAHIEAGYFVGHPDKELHIITLEDQEPELMYKMANGIYAFPFALREALA